MVALQWVVEIISMDFRYDRAWPAGVFRCCCDRLSHAWANLAHLGFRSPAPSGVQIKGVKTSLDIVALPSAHGPLCRDLATALMGLPMRDAETGVETADVYPELKLLANFLSPTLMNPNAIVHPSITYGAFASWDGKPFASPPLFYQGVCVCVCVCMCVCVAVPVRKLRLSVLCSDLLSGGI